MALSLSVWLDRTSARPDAETRAHLVVEIVAPRGEAVEGPRPRAATVLALDVSGSMQGAPLDQVIRSVDFLLDALRPEDRVGLVAFSGGAARVAEPVLVDAAGKRLVRARVARLFAEGETNLEAGLEVAAEMLSSGLPEDLRRGVVLLSDGVPTRGAVEADALRAIVKKHRPDVSFASLGYGLAHGEEVLSAIGEAGGAGYAFVPDPASCMRAFARALGAQADVVASAIEIAILPAEGVEIARVLGLGREETRFGKDGLAVSLGDMVPETTRVIAAEITVRAGAQKFLVDVARVVLRWRGRTSSPLGLCEERRELSLEVADREPGVVAEAASRVMLVRADLAREEARAIGDRGQFGGAAARIRAVLREIEKVPGFVQADGSPLAEAYELLVDEATAFERQPSPEAYAMFRKSAVASKVAAPAPPSSHAMKSASAKLLEHAAGAYPEAFLVVVAGPGAGARHRLHEECTIGRTASADIAVASDAVSRRHAEVYALEGEYWACDLGSTNPTALNGASLHSAPAKLRHGDVLRVGDVDLRYEESLKKGP